MEENKPQEMDQSTNSASTTNGEAKPDEPLDDFVVLDDVGLLNKVGGKKNLTTEKKPTEGTKNDLSETSGENKDKPIEPVKDTKDKEDPSAAKNNTETENTNKSEKVEPAVNDHEKNGDALILTADEDLEPGASSPKKTITEGVPEVDEAKQATAESTLPNTETQDNSKPSTDALPISKQRAIWVSNISKTIKATDLKQYLSKAGKVNTAKVVTDGKRCFGYVVMENAADAIECVKTLNDTSFDGKTIFLSFDKPTKVTASKPSESHTKKVAPKERAPRSSDAKRGEKRRRSSSKTKSEKDKNTTETTTKTEDSKTSTTDKPPEKKNKSRSRSRERYIRDRNEQDRLRRRLEEEDRKNRETRKRQTEIEERQREKEFKLDQERRKLQMERELFEKQKKEWARINEERRKLEKARLEIEQQRTKLEEDLKKERMKRKSPEMPSVVSKISDPSKKSMKGMNLYNGPTPPPPKLSSDYMISGRKQDDLKMGRSGGRKMEVVDRKFYGDSSDRKKHYVRKPEFEESKSYVKRYPGERDAEHRTQWSPPASYNAGVGSSSQRYQESAPPQQYGGGPPAPRASSYYYHAPGTTPEFSRYDHASNRKY